MKALTIQQPWASAPEDYISNNEENILKKHGAEEDISGQLDMDYAGVKIIPT